MNRIQIALSLFVLLTLHINVVITSIEINEYERIIKEITISNKNINLDDASNNPPRPHIGDFYGNAELNIPGGYPNPYTGIFANGNSTNRYFFYGAGTTEFPAGATQTNAVLTLPDAIYSIFDQQCRQIPNGRYVPFFWFVPFAKYTGTKQYNNRQCNNWELNIKSQNQSFNACVDMNNANKPVAMTIVNHASGALFAVSSYIFSDSIKLATPKPQFFNLPPQCVETIICEGNGTIDMGLYRIHAKGDYSLDNQNVADLIGDTEFLCSIVLAPKIDPFYQLLSIFEVSVNSSFGQYGFCNFGNCIGGNHHLVGREVTLGANKPLAGQCTKNEVMGSWFSLEASAKCNGTRVVGDGCAWKATHRVKTIDIQCILASGLVDACKTETFPFTNSTNIIVSALNNCADVPPKLFKNDIQPQPQLHQRKTAANMLFEHIKQLTLAN